MSKPPKFSMHDFKKFMSKQEGLKDFFKLEEEDTSNAPPSFIGCEVKAKAPRLKLEEKIDVDLGEADELLDEFCDNGGVIADVIDKNVLIEVNSGSFFLPRSYVKIIKND